MHQQSRTRVLVPLLGSLALAAAAAAAPGGRDAKAKFTTDWKLEGCAFTNTGRSRFVVLEPGHEVRLAGQTKRGWEDVTITVGPDNSGRAPAVGYAFSTGLRFSGGD